jgi:lipoic acid synthetase
VPKIERKPPWLKAPLPGGPGYLRVRGAVSSGRLHTVCEEARCPNVGECWNAGTATFLILGDTCTRGCAFCAISRGATGRQLDPEEPRRVAEAAAEMGLDYAVVTSVTRDDLDDGGASHFAATVRALRALEKPPLVELLAPDYLGAPLEAVVDAGPDVFAHNVEVVERLQPALRHGRFDFRRSLATLEAAKARDPRLVTKSSILLGLGETGDELEDTMRALRSAGVGILALGQYLRPSPRHAEVVEYVAPARFEALKELGERLGFDFVASAPLVRTSYRAAEAFVRGRKATA